MSILYSENPAVDDRGIHHTESLRLQDKEVMDARWATLDEIFAMIDSGEFIPFMKSFIAFLFEMRNGTDNLNM